MPYIYILKGERFYVGSTTDLERRLAEHERGKTHTTKRIGVWSLVFKEEFATLKEARDEQRPEKREERRENKYQRSEN